SDQFPITENFGSAFGRSPAQQCQKISERLWHDTLLAISHYAGCAVPFAQACLVCAKDQRHVSEHWQCSLESSIKQHLLRSIRNVICAADDMRNAEINIVRDHAQVIGRGSVGAQQHKVFKFGIRKLDVAEDRIGESCAASLWDRESHSGWLTRSF